MVVTFSPEYLGIMSVVRYFFYHGVILGTGMEETQEGSLRSVACFWKQFQVVKRNIPGRWPSLLCCVLAVRVRYRALVMVPILGGCSRS